MSTEITNRSEIIVCYEADDDDRRVGKLLQDWIDGVVGASVPATVRVGKFRNQAWRGGKGMGAQRMGVHVVATMSSWRGHWEVYNKLVPHGPTYFDPDRRNNMGQLGAYMDPPPSDEAIQAAIDRAVATIRREANRPPVRRMTWEGTEEKRDGLVVALECGHTVFYRDEYISGTPSTVRCDACYTGNAGRN